MIDKMSRKNLRRAALGSSVCLYVIAAPAFAGEDVLYADAASWVEPASIESATVSDSPASLVMDWQHRLEDGVVTSYTDTATRIDNPQALMEHGTISLSWLPDKGDLTIHRVEIQRAGKSIDVIGGGAEFDVIRREQGLEQRLLDGQLTATLAVPGLQVGDILRVTHSITIDDQALGDEMQVLQYLWPAPWQVGFARTIVSWPEDEQVFWRAEDHAALGEPVSKNGEKRLEVALPLAEMPDMPYDAPSRFSRAPVLRVGTYADWQELSRTMAPHFAKAAEVEPGSAIAEQARAIMAKTKDPLRRAALATQLVQDEVSYLLNGLDGGNYLPQDADLTWEKRYGDCKAKSVLLHALLSEMGIQSQTVLVSTRGGDAIPELLPVPGNFDHMIVRAVIDGQDYWLDGTSAATRLSNMAAVPPFHYALPLTAEGNDLVPMTQRDQPTPNMVMSVVSDYSAGIDIPALFTLEMKFYGPQGAGFRKMADEADEDSLRQVGKSFAMRNGGGAVSSVTLDYDDEEAVGTLVVTGIADSEFQWKQGRLVVESDMTPNAAFNATRAKPEWREIPVATSGPMRSRMLGELILPKGMDGFVYEGSAKTDAAYANTRVSSVSGLEGNRFSGEVEVIQNLGEIAPEQLPEVKRAVRRIASEQSRLLAPEDVVWRWELDRKELDKRIEPILEEYGKAIAFAEDDDYAPLTARGGFLHDVYRFEDALADANVLVEKDTSANVLQWRSGILYSLGRSAEAIADLKRAYDIEPENWTAMQLAEMLAYDGQYDEAVELLESLPISDEDSSGYAGTYATVMGLKGDTEAALHALAEETAAKPQNADGLNSDCWFRGLFNTGLEGALDVCTRAIERASNSAPMLDSRAMVHYRMGNYQAALADLDSALDLSPGLSASHYLRGAVRLAMGDKGGREDIAIALRISPELRKKYDLHGVKVD